MPTYDYLCETCGARFERMQAMSEAPLVVCPECGGVVQRLLSGGAGFIMKNSPTRHPAGGRGGSCAFESTGRTCCGRDERCADPECGGRE